MMKSILLIVLTVLLTGCGEEKMAGPKVDVLFIGNSYTSVNNLPKILADLALSGHRQVVTDMFAPGGWTLAQHAESKDALDKISGKKWDFVVLQEQSIVPSVEQSREQGMYPAVRSLAGRIRQTDADPVLYMTWGRQKGLAEFGFGDFNSMQAQLTSGYMGIANELHLKVAPVGVAWKTAVERDPDLQLWQGDGSHPTLEGTYLAACVFYAVLFQKSPEGLDYPEAISKKTAKALQTVAAETVLTDPSRWNLR